MELLDGFFPRSDDRLLGSGLVGVSLVARKVRQRASWALLLRLIFVVLIINHNSLTTMWEPGTFFIIFLQ